jgi:hypothetical protein
MSQRPAPCLRHIALAAALLAGSAVLTPRSSEAQASPSLRPLALPRGEVPVRCRVLPPDTAASRRALGKLHGVEFTLGTEATPEQLAHQQWPGDRRIQVRFDSTGRVVYFSEVAMEAGGAERLVIHSIGAAVDAAGRMTSFRRQHRSSDPRPAVPSRTDTTAIRAFMQREFPPLTAEEQLRVKAVAAWAWEHRCGAR